MSNDPVAFRNDYKTAASVKATRLSANSIGVEVWSAVVYDSANAALGVPVIASSLAPFVSRGTDAISPRLLDLEVVAPGPWTANGDGTYSAAAHSQRA